MLENELARINELANREPKIRLQTLVHVLNEENLKYAHNQLKKDKAAGIDQETKLSYEENLKENIKNLVDRMKRQAYKPKPAKRVYIPKEGKVGEKRPLGIPAYEDKLVQYLINKILIEIYDDEFTNFSYGFRESLNCHEALRHLDKVIMRKKVNWIVDADIKGFFDNISHEWMMKFLEHRIEDKNLLRIIKRFLKAGIMDKNIMYETTKGTPQGGIISPILANIYLHYILDLWFEVVIVKQCKGEAYIVRYCDDFVCCFQYESEAQRFYKDLIERLKKFGLEVAIEKTKIIRFGRFAKQDRKEKGLGKPETFDFLGFTHYCSICKRGNFRVKRKTSKKKFNSKSTKFKNWIMKAIHMPVSELIKRVNVRLIGHYKYYGISFNYNKIKSFRTIAYKLLYKALSRRSQKGILWEKFRKILFENPLARPKIYVKLF